MLYTPYLPKYTEPSELKKQQYNLVHYWSTLIIGVFL